VRFGGVTAVDEASFSVARGTVRALIGPNGAGKTTLFNAIAGAVQPTAGRVRIAGVPAEGLQPYRRAALGFARTFQHATAFGSLTVLETAQLGLHASTREGALSALLRSRRQRTEERAIRDAALEALGRVGLERRAAEDASTLSYGDRKLLDLARAIAAKPALLALDEPLAGVAGSMIATIEAILHALKAAGTAIVCIEHNIPTIMRIADGITVLSRGRVIADGTPDAVRSDPAVIDAYLGTAVLRAAG
jgi:branched-chain amino acid transport system ATP-binding protein